MAEDLYTVAEAAEAWGITRQAVYKRMTTLVNQGFVVYKGKSRYITREGLDHYLDNDNPNDNQVDNLTTKNDNLVNQLITEVDSLKEQLNQAKADLLAEQGRANTLQATIDAQEAHIDSLKTALDREQALHMASLQKRLPGPRKGLFDWLKGRKGEE